MDSPTNTISALPSPDEEASLERLGCLEADVISVFDLPSADIPTAVTLSACGKTVSTGKPLAQKKNRKSFSFSPLHGSGGTSTTTSSSSNNNSNTTHKPTKLRVPLRELYQATLKVRVTYADPDRYLEAELPLRDLAIHESQYKILNLEVPSPLSDTEGSDTNSHASGDVSVQTAERRRIFPVNEEDKPTIRMKLKLSGPFRTEIAALVNFANLWFGVVDSVEGKFSRVASLGPKMSGKNNFNKNLLLVPAVPFLAVMVAVSPLLAGVVALAVPFLLPLALVCVGLMAATLLSGGLLYSSTKSGRKRVGMALTPLVETLVVSKPGQALVYDTGPRPTPVSVCRQIMPSTIWSKLLISLIIDLIGSSSYLLPVVGEGFDIGWAPAQTILIMALYEDTTPNLKYLSFLEEALPFTDIVPSASIGWACEFLPVIWNEHREKNDISPEVTQAVTQLVTTAANAVRTRNQRNGVAEHAPTTN